MDRGRRCLPAVPAALGATAATLRTYQADLQRDAGQRLLGYVQANAQGIANLAGLEATGSGAAEKTVDVLVGHRYKKRGMSWGRPGGGALMHLRLLKANGEWEALLASAPGGVCPPGGLITDESHIPQVAG